jgi:succinate dehydrogenase hydrophobic anchor subunit
MVLAQGPTSGAGTVWRQASPAWRIATVVGVAAAVYNTVHGMWLLVGIAPDTSASSDIRMLLALLALTVPVIIIFWREMVLWGRFSWVWALGWMAPLYAYPVLILTSNPSAPLWLIGIFCPFWAGIATLLLIPLQCWVAWRGLRIWRDGVAAAAERGQHPRAQSKVGLGLIWVLAIWTVACMAFPRLLLEVASMMGR